MKALRRDCMVHISTTVFMIYVQLSTFRVGLPVQSPVSSMSFSGDPQNIWQRPSDSTLNLKENGMHVWLSQ